jgi:hypothetical protein
MTPMIAPDRAEISRRNGAKSKGPKTPEGKERSKFNALKHGMRARTIVLPDEDADVLQIRINTWTDDLQPQSDLERDLIVRAAALSWQLDRADSTIVARLASTIRHAAPAAALHQQAEAAALGRLLFRDPHGSYREFLCNTRPPSERICRQFGASALAADPDHPATLVYELEATPAGCQWLLDQWAELRTLLDQGQAWKWPERLKALRLLGKPTPIGSVDKTDPIAAAVLPAKYIREVMVLGRDDDEDEIDEDEIDENRAEGQLQLKEGLRDSEARAAMALPAIISRTVARLEVLAQGHRERAEADAAEATARLAFDGSAEGERLRRYQMSSNRALLRTIESIAKVRRTGQGPGPNTDELAAREFVGEGEPHDSARENAPNDESPGSAFTLTPALLESDTGIDTIASIAHNDSFGVELPTVKIATTDRQDPPNPIAGSPHEPTAPHDDRNLPNEPGSAAVARRNPQDGPNNPGRRSRDSRPPEGSRSRSLPGTVKHPAGSRVTRLTPRPLN